RPAQKTLASAQAAVAAQPSGGEGARAALDRLYFGGGPSGADAPEPEQGGTPRRPRVGLRAQTELGVVSDPRSLDGRVFTLDQWRYLSFVTEADPGEALIDGKPPAESKLEAKAVVRDVPDGNSTRRWRRYSWLALGATPAGRYQVSFPGFSFAVEVRQTDHSTPEERLASARKAVSESLRGAFSGDVGEAPPFGPGVPEAVRRWLPSHLSFMGRYLREHEAYLGWDGLVGERERGRRAHELETLKEYYADVVSGARPMPGLSALIAQLLAREDGVLRQLRSYMVEDPGMGRAAGEAFALQLDSHREMLRGAYELHVRVDALPPPGPVKRLLGRLLGGWMR
ncbi:MAG: hypothetical protein KGL53_05765, partial [Elusimicrobia bacterium]|nr:hypothetical protein [Elusimicrobiota bacterium]